MSERTFEKGKSSEPVAAKAASGGLRIGAQVDAFERKADRVAGGAIAEGLAKHQRSISSVGLNTPFQRKYWRRALTGSIGGCEEGKKKRASRSSSAKLHGPRHRFFGPSVGNKYG